MTVLFKNLLGGQKWTFFLRFSRLPTLFRLVLPHRCIIIFYLYYTPMSYHRAPLLSVQERGSSETTAATAGLHRFCFHHSKLAKSCGNNQVVNVSTSYRHQNLNISNKQVQ